MADPLSALPSRSDRDPARWLGVGEVVRLAIPTVVNTVSVTVMQFVDAWMVSDVGPAALSAQLAGGMSAFSLICFFLGVLSSVSTYASQNLGAGRPERAALYGWHGLWVAWGAAAVLVSLIPMAPYALGLLSDVSPEVTHLATQYFRLMLLGTVFSLPARALGAWFIGVHRPQVNVVAGVIANGVNVWMNWLLIYGHFGLPRLGLVGAGIGTVVGFSVEASILMGAFLFSGVGRRFGVRGAIGLRWGAIRDLFRIGAPAGAMFTGEMLMWAIFTNRIVGSFGTAHMTAAAILMRYWQLCFMPALGVGAASTAIVGRYCGAGRPRLAWRRAHAALLLVEAYMVTTGLIIWFGRDTFVGLFNGLEIHRGGPWGLALDGTVSDPLIQSIATRAILFIVLCQAFDAMSVTFSGALRGAGDTLWPGAVQLVLAYTVGLGGSTLVAYMKPDWGSLGPWAMVSAYVIAVGCAMWGRFLSGRWRRMRLVEVPVKPLMDEPADLPPPP